MLVQLPKQSLGRQIANCSIAHESWLRSPHRALVRTAIPQQSSTRHYRPLAVQKGTPQLQASFPRQLVRQQGRNQQALAMHESFSASDYAASSQAAEQPMGAASTSSAAENGETTFQSQRLLFDRLDANTCSCSLPVGKYASLH